MTFTGSLLAHLAPQEILAAPLLVAALAVQSSNPGRSPFCPFVRPAGRRSLLAPAPPTGTRFTASSSPTRSPAAAPGVRPHVVLPCTTRSSSARLLLVEPSPFLTGFVWGLCGGLGIGLPPVLHFGSDYLKHKARAFPRAVIVPSCATLQPKTPRTKRPCVSPECRNTTPPSSRSPRAQVCGPCLAGEKFICLAITEPYAGSDVAAIRSTAIKDPTGKFYVLNGEKKWITNGVFADYFTVAVRTGGPGAEGISLLLVERGPGVSTKQMDCMGVWSSGTTYITFEDVMVPVENLIGEENNGFKYIMYNFNQVMDCSASWLKNWGGWPAVLHVERSATSALLSVCVLLGSSLLS